MDEQTSEKMSALAARVLDDGIATPEEVKRLAGCVLTQKTKLTNRSKKLKRAKAKAKK